MYFLWIFTASFGLVQALSNCSYQALQEYLGLDKDSIRMTSLRPVLHWKTPTFVLADLYLSSITEVSAKAQTFSLQVFLEMGWVNELIKWNPEDFCGITSISVSKEMLWIPDICVLETIILEFSTQEAPFLRIFSHGMVIIGQSYTMTSTCKMDLQLFPFDTQSCSLTLQSTLHNIGELQISSFSNASMLTQSSKHLFQSQGEWDLININTSKSQLEATGRVWDQLTYTITIKRRPLLYVVIFLLPVLYFLALDLASFFIDEDRGEKLGFKVTVLLAISVLLLILNDMLPSTSNELPVIGVYCATIFTFMTASLLETILVTFLKTCNAQIFPKLCGKLIPAPVLQDNSGINKSSDIAIGKSYRYSSQLSLSATVTKPRGYQLERELHRSSQEQETVGENQETSVSFNRFSQSFKKHVSISQPQKHRNKSKLTDGLKWL